MLCDFGIVLIFFYLTLKIWYTTNDKTPEKLRKKK